MGPEELAAAGLYDPAAPHAGERLELLTFLVGLGATMEDLVEGRDELPVVASDVALRVGRERLGLDEVSERSGVPADVILRIWRASGFAEPEPGARPFSEVDVEMMASLQAVLHLIDAETVLQLIRVMGSAMARVADAMVSTFVVNVSAGAMAEDPGGMALARANAEASALIPAAAQFLDMLLRRHTLAMRRPLAILRSDMAGYEAREMTVGFADLVGSTALTRRLPMSDLGAAIGDFEAMASDLVTANGGRLVKLIGDEAMFVMADAARACEVGLALADAVGTHPVLPAIRVGVAAGEVLSRDGDCFGPVVNLAARVVKAAPPGGVVTTEEVRVDLEGRRPGVFRFESLGAQALAGFDEQVELVVVTTARTGAAQ